MGMSDSILDIELQGATLTTKEFRNLIAVHNEVPTRKPSIMGTYIGNAEDTLHRHNVFMTDDAWYQVVSKLVTK